MRDPSWDFRAAVTPGCSSTRSALPKQNAVAPGPLPRLWALHRPWSVTVSSGLKGRDTQQTRPASSSSGCSGAPAGMSRRQTDCRFSMHLHPNEYVGSPKPLLTWGTNGLSWHLPPCPEASSLHQASATATKFCLRHRARQRPAQLNPSHGSRKTQPLCEGIRVPVGSPLLTPPCPTPHRLVDIHGSWAWA